MRPSSLMFTDTVTIVTPGTKTNRTDTPIPDWATASRAEARVRLSQRGGSGGSVSEDNAQRSAQVSQWVAYFPTGTVIDGRCRVEKDGATFEVVGPPYEPTTLTGVGHVEVILRLVEG